MQVYQGVFEINIDQRQLFVDRVIGLVILGQYGRTQGNHYTYTHCYAAWGSAQARKISRSHKSFFFSAQESGRPPDLAAFLKKRGSGCAFS
jgi:hypothetical protein